MRRVEAPGRHYQDGRDPKFIQRLSPFLEGLYRNYFRVADTGWENVPVGQQVLFVGNHNGLLTFEMLMLFYAAFKRYGMDLNALGLAHDIALKNPLFRWLAPRLGGIPANPRVAEEAVADGYSLMIYPGGLREAFRPFRERKRVNFYGHKGFIRLARKTGLPLVPVVSVGAAESYVILDRGEELAKALGVYDRLKLAGIPITYRSLFFMWCVVSGLFTFFPLLLAPAALFSVFIPLPTQMTFRILPPIDIRGLWNESESEEANVDRIYNHVLAVFQFKVDEEYSKRKFPVLG